MVPAGGGGCVPHSMQQTAGVMSPSIDETVLVQCLNEISKAAAVHLQMAQKTQANVMKIMNELVDVRKKRQFGEEEPTFVDFLRNSSTAAQDAFDGTAQALKPNAVLGTAMDTDAKPDGVLRQVLSSASIRTTTTHQSLQTTLSDEVDQSPKAIRAGDNCMTNDVSSDQVSAYGKAVPTADCMLSAANGEEKDDDDEDDSDDEDEDYEDEEDEDGDKLEAGGEEEEDVEGEEEEGDDDVEEEGETEDNGEGEDDDGEEDEEEDMDGDDDDPEDEPEDEEEEGDDGEDEDDEDAEGESEEEVPEVEPPKKKRK